MSLIESYLFELQEKNIPKKWRPRVEVYVLKDKKILVGMHPEIGLHVPGGGIEEDQDLIEAAKNECLEEAGVEITNVKLITKENYYEDWYKLDAEGQPITKKDRMRMATFRGIKHHYLRADYVGVDKSRLGADNDALKKLKFVSKEELIKAYEKQSKVFDPAQYALRIKLVKKL
jgi:8-oxo-dGTP pyrophosphatase MutT (NUDIX family)